MISPVEPPFVNATTGTLTPVSFRFLWGLFSDIQTLQASGGGGTVGPPGPQGPPGPTGPAGTAATVTTGTTTTGSPGTPANVTNSGTSSAAVFNFTIPEGIQGATGSQGPQGNPGATGSPGAAATIAAGTTTTLAPGSSATVTNSGSSSAAVFNFGIPQGVQGATGPQGPNWLVGPGLALNTATTPNTVDVATPYLPLSGGTVSGNFTVSGTTALGAATGQTVAAATNSTALATTAYVQSQNYLTANQTITLSGDVGGSGTTAITTTLATVNANVGTWNTLTVNGKGLVTAGSNTAYLTANQTVTLSGDVTGSGPTAITATVARLQGQPVSATAPTSGQVLQWSGTSWTPTTPAAPGTGTVTSITAGTGLTGGTITTSGTLGLSVPVAIANGGTNATSAAAALTNLGGAPIASPSFTGTVTVPTLALTNPTTLPGGSAANRNFNIQGVTDGSNAPAGMVGEFVTVTVAPVGGIANGAWGTAGSITLTAGDWDLWGIATIGGSYFASQTAVGFSSTFGGAANYGGSSPNLNFNAAIITGVVLPLQPVRINVTASTTVYLNFFIFYSSGGSPQCGGTISARRMR
jgi:hypothetical protein